MTDPILLRRRVRFILSTLPRKPKKRRAGEDLLFAKLLPDFSELKVDELTTALSWNHASGYVDYVFNTDQERNEWALTDEGWQKEGLS